MKMIHHYARNYRTDHQARGCLPSLEFYYDVFKIVGRAGFIAKRNNYSAAHWVRDSYLVAQALENLGTNIFIEGHENITKLEKPCVFVSNHMSTLETFFLPSIIQPVKDVTFVVKASLLKYPGLGPVLGAREPIVITRTNPKEDLANVLENGQKILAGGRSIIIFPQGTRYPNVTAENFSSLGIKLAKRANVPIIPIALRTDAWGVSDITKDFGKISPSFPVFVRFGEAIEINGNGKAEHQQCLEFIQKNFNIFYQENI